MEFPGEFLERRALSSAACFVTYRRLPAYKKPNGGRSDPPPYNPRVPPIPVLSIHGAIPPSLRPYHTQLRRPREARGCMEGRGATNLQARRRERGEEEERERE